MKRPVLREVFLEQQIMRRKASRLAVLEAGIELVTDVGGEACDLTFASHR